MKRLFKARILMLIALLLMGAFTGAAAQRPNRPLPSPPVDHPFAFKGHGIATYITDGSGNITGATTTIAGTVSPLALWSAIGELQFTPDLHATGRATFTTDNGDQLYVLIKDSVVDFNTLISHGSADFVGGTGRYANATGGVELVVSQNLLSGAFETVMVGTLRY